MNYNGYCTYDIADYFLLGPFVFRHAFFHSVVYGISYGVFQGLIYFVCGAAFRFWAYLIVSRLPYFSVLSFYRDFLLIFPTFAFGTLAVVAARSSAPDYAKAKLSANRIFKLLDHKPTVDWESNKGNKLVSSIEISITCAYYLRWIRMSLKSVLWCRRMFVERSLYARSTSPTQLLLT